MSSISPSDQYDALALTDHIPRRSRVSAGGVELFGGRSDVAISRSATVMIYGQKAASWEKGGDGDRLGRGHEEATVAKAERMGRAQGLAPR